MWRRYLFLTLWPFNQSQAPFRPLTTTANATSESYLDLELPTRELSSICDTYEAGDEVSNTCVPDNLLSARQILDVSLFLSLYEISGLDALLRCSGPLTVLLPTNDAVINLGEERLKELLDPSNLAELTELLLYHVIPTKALENGLVPTLAEGASIFYEAGIQAFDLVTSTRNSTLSCNGQLVLLKKVLNPSTNTNRPSSLPSVTPSTSAPSGIPSSGPSSSQTSVEVDPFVIVYRSQNATKPSDDDIAQLNDDIVAYYTSLFTSLFESDQSFRFEGLSFEIDFTLYGDDALPGFNIFVQYRPAILTFSRTPNSQGQLPENKDLFLEMLNGITADFIFDVVRTQQGTAFEAVNSVRMLLVPQREQLGKFFIAYNSQNSTKPDTETFQELARVNQLYFNDYFQSIYEDFVGLNLKLESTAHDAEIVPAIDGYNLLIRYSNAVFLFTADSLIPSDLELFDFLQQGITVEYLLEVRQLFVGTAFGEVDAGLLDVEI